MRTRSKLHTMKAQFVRAVSQAARDGLSVQHEGTQEQDEEILCLMRTDAKAETLPQG